MMLFVVILILVNDIGLGGVIYKKKLSLYLNLLCRILKVYLWFSLKIDMNVFMFF